MRKSSFATRCLLWVLTAFACFGAIGQIVNTVSWFRWRGMSWNESVVRMLSYLTNLTAIVAACCFVCVFLAVMCADASTRSRLSILRGLPAWTYRPSNITAVTLYLAFVGCGYNLLLRHYGERDGIRAVLNETVHTIVPFLAMLYWCLAVPRFTPVWTRLSGWLIYPVAYLVFILWRGGSSHFYPYPFLNVDRLGEAQVAENVLGLIVGFLVLMAAMLGINRCKPGVAAPMADR